MLASAASEFDPVYIVRLKDPPVAAYSGGIGGYPATAPAATAAIALDKLTKSATNAAKQLWRKRTKLNVRAPNVKAFVKFLKNQQTKIAQDAGVAASKIIHSYTHVQNGLAAVLSPKEVRDLQAHPDVAAVTQSVRLAPSTTHSPQFLRLPQTLWKSAGGEASAGEDVVIGVVDTGIWPEHASFANTAANPYGDPPKTFTGECEPTPDFPRTKCNGKLVGARYFNAAFYKQTKGKIDTTEDYSSARDTNGHGTWCASAAAGNKGVVLDGDIKISGMAPRARLAAYKVFWRNSDGDSWANSADVNAAVDSAVMDGVDVIGLSLGGVNPTGTYFDDMATLNALAAGVVVVFAAGNAGSVHPAKGEYRLIDNFSPWYLSVGASTISIYTDMLANAIASPASKTALTASDDGDDSTNSQTTASTSGSGSSGGSGGGGSSGSSGAGAGGAAGADAGGGAGADALADAGTTTDSVSSKESKDITFSESYTNPNEAPIVAFFSSTGPLVAPAAIPASGRPTNDILKPDIIAPGFQLWGAAPSPKLTDYDNYFKRLSGTSMATPHVAGIVALIIQERPTWTPAQIMSAIMTTASVRNNKKKPIRVTVEGRGERVATPWEMGAGHVNPTSVLDPGLTYDSNQTEYRNFLAGLDFNLAKWEFRSIAVSPIRACNLNRASISVSKVAKTEFLDRARANCNLHGYIYS
ncbi:unnamed protein product [Closterium sp. Yama58-4]|nr:unnamed protein product [Closterium sp. Yama58-4]